MGYNPKRKYRELPLSHSEAELEANVALLAGICIAGAGTTVSSSSNLHLITLPNVAIGTQLFYSR